MRNLNQKIQNLKKRPITNAEFEQKNLTFKKIALITHKQCEPKIPKFQKGTDYPYGIWTKIPPLLKLEVGFFPDI